ncbi:uncharacterized protein LOC122094782 [Macadamia integrifolia]|uniref:uncharacterized protein LOC122094782 n=1 Tax=Macadamia integrifolia TaxID=60698 RepID=UPI001C531BAB|nr:uncharacterized protein LOC122094782 [Macadamia integrifolia]
MDSVVKQEIFETGELLAERCSGNLSKPVSVIIPIPSDECLPEIVREKKSDVECRSWLEEFERAIRLSYRNRSKGNTTARHNQFIAAIEEQICHVEKALIESLEEEGKQPLRWVNLDEEERDDFTSFLSRTPGTSQGTKEGNDDLRPTTDNSLKGIDRRRKVADFHIDLACRIDNPE